MEDKNKKNSVKVVTDKKTLDLKANNLKGVAQEGLDKGISVLKEIYTDTEERTADRLKAIELLSKMGGLIGSAQDSQPAKQAVVFNIGPEKKERIIEG